MTAHLRQTMGDAAVAAAKAVAYIGAGTVEFIVPAGLGGDTFYFMEMNTRLQVEHPVTEMITGLDLVEWQLRVAAGEALPLTQENIRINGHALEARIYAEDAERGFLPATGRITHLATPAESSHVRIDTGIAAGDSITPWYDPMIAKLIVWDADRQSALARMRSALAAYQVAGITTNADFLARLVGCAAFTSADLDTGLIARNHDTLFPPPPPLEDAVLALASFAELLHQQETATLRAAASADPASPWALADGWRLNEDNRQVLHFSADAGEVSNETVVVVHCRPIGWDLELGGRHCKLRGERLADGRLAIRLDDVAVTGTVVKQGAILDVFHAGLRHTLHVHDPLERSADAEESSGSLAAPMPGKIIAVLVRPGAAVARGAPLLILEAMKMEHTICAPADGVVAAIYFQAGDQVGDGAELISIEAPTAGAANP
jgi:3-methylcrotonyl-CoA carboxylase alpha subunit